MRIHDVRITAADVPAAARFYSETLGFPVRFDGDLATVRIGKSTLTMVPGAPYPGSHHLAFTIPAGSLPAAREWLAARVPLLTDAAGHEVLGCLPNWQARSLYFTGPDDSILELIERNILDNDIDHAFGVDDIRSISEVAFGVADVSATQQRMRESLGLLPFGEPLPDFGPVGDHDGLFIVMAADRAMRPQDAVVVAQAPTVVTADIPAELRIGEHYRVLPAA